MVKAQRLNPQDAQLPIHLTFLSRAYVNAREYTKAVDCARLAVERRSDYAPAHFILAIALSHLGNLDDGLAALEECGRLQPGMVESRKQWRPYLDESSNQHLREGLVKLLAASK